VLPVRIARPIPAWGLLIAALAKLIVQQIGFETPGGDVGETK
jgi:hypothetical protein